MKRFLVFILTLCYLVATTGTSLHLHFCMGSLADLSMGTMTQNKTCGKCGMEKQDKPNGCCRDEVNWLKLQDDQHVNGHFFQFAKMLVAEPADFFKYNFTPDISIINDLLPNNHAPPTNGVAVYKRNCVFRI